MFAYDIYSSLSLLFEFSVKTNSCVVFVEDMPVLVLHETSPRYLDDCPSVEAIDEVSLIV